MAGSTAAGAGDTPAVPTGQWQRPGWGSGPLPMTSSRMVHLWGALSRAYDVLGFERPPAGMRRSANWCWLGSSSLSASWTACGCWDRPPAARRHCGCGRGHDLRGQLEGDPGRRAVVHPGHARPPRPYAVAQWRSEHPGEDIPEAKASALTWWTDALANRPWESSRSPGDLTGAEVRVEQAQAGAVTIHDVGVCRPSVDLCRCTYLAEKYDLAARGPGGAVACPARRAHPMNPRPIRPGDLDYPRLLKRYGLVHEGDGYPVWGPRWLDESGGTARERGVNGAVRVRRVDLGTTLRRQVPGICDPVAHRPRRGVYPVGVPGDAGV